MRSVVTKNHLLLPYIDFYSKGYNSPPPFAPEDLGVIVVLTPADRLQCRRRRKTSNTSSRSPTPVC